MEQIYIPKQDYKVLVRCFTYNQSNYIEDALNGFAMQQTDFPFACLVMDDCSTDDEQEVIKEWMERECDMVKAEYIDIELSNVIIVPHKSNTSCTFAFYFLKQNLHGSGKKKMNMVYPWRECCEYEAICEGDDYWIDPFKLKEQNFYLDTHLDCCLIWAKAKCYIQNKNKFSGYIGDKTESLTELLYKNGVSTLTTMFRISALVGYSDTIKGMKWLMGDKPLWLYFSINKKIHFENKVYGVYRVLQQSASLRNSYEARKRFIISSNDVCQFFSEKFAPEEMKRLEEKRNFELFSTAFEYKKYKEAQFFFKKLNYFSFKVIAKYLICLFFIKIDKVKKCKHHEKNS